ncbi:thioester reductase [Bradyrhizobium japonicum]|uniref:Thioester reductase n=1 Tax=Bradyrhizobium japonicum TaxID=375 RepID=A0A0A3XS20_BRAJP|nr:non-ribosomal peptide synthetase [Bradyrhizobium japonicum]KGT76054.1 thioester reductase [Bradyrhizobium japonicum]
MFKTFEPSQNEAADTIASSRVFSHLEGLIAHYARVVPGRDAILAPGRPPLTYAALWEQTNNAVRELRRCGIGRSDRVAVVLPTGADAAAGVIAVAASAICVPLNPSFAADEWQRYFADLQVAALLTRADVCSASRGVAHTLGIPIIDLSVRPGAGIGAFDFLGSGTRQSVGKQPALHADNDAFILLTSGTEARPKLIPLTHGAICRSAYNAGAAVALEPQDRLLNMLPLFHAHGLISGLLTALAAGTSVVCTPGFDPAAFFGWLTEFRPTWYTAVPTIHRAVLSEARRRDHGVGKNSLRVIRSASASLPVNVLSELEAQFGVPVIETYGMTEAASQIAANPLTRRKPGSVGQSAGAEIAIMDTEGRRLGAGERGEITLRGPTITKGYDNDPAATEYAFRDGWFRTGDLGYLDRDGYLFIVGRIKDVIKRGGQQVAPAEVEEVLLGHPDVIEAAAFAISHQQFGEDVAAAVVRRSNAKISAQKLRNFAGDRLAKFKVPSLILFVPRIPKGPSGKIKRSELASALASTLRKAQAKRDGNMVAPRSELERHLARIWTDVLELNQIGVDQDVFALGADSIKVTQTLSRVWTQLGTRLSFNDIFDAPTVAALAARIESHRDSAAVAPGLRDTSTDAGKASLSYQQQRIQVLSRLDPTGYSYNVLEVVRLFGPLDVDALAASIGRIWERHEVLRSTFPHLSVKPLQIVGKVRPRLEQLDVRPCAKSKRTAAVQRLAQETGRQTFDLEKGPLLQARLLRLDETDHALVINIHHLITDGWSQRLFWEELRAHFAAGIKGAPTELPKLPVQYRHFAEWQRTWLATPAAEEQRRYWRTQLAGVTELPLRTDRQRPETWTGRGARQPLKLSRTLSRTIKSLSRSHGVTSFMTLLATFQCLLYRYTHHEDVAVGSVIANRNQVDLERLMGMFANTIVLRTDLSGDPSFSEVLRRVRQVTLSGYRNQDLPFEKVLQTLQVSRSMDRNTLFQVMFILQNPPPRAPALPGLSAHLVGVDPGIARVDLTLELIDADERLGGWFEYNTDLFEAATIRRMAAHLKILLEAIVANPEERISRLRLLPEEERKRVLVDYNDTQTSFPRLGSFSERFAKHAKRSPDAIAASDRRVQLSYRELARRSSTIANRLARNGVGADVVVILLAERGVDFLAAMMAVQQVGAAFLPLDPSHPAAWLAQIIEHSRTPLVLAGHGGTAVIEKALSEVPARRRPKVLSLPKLAQVSPGSPCPVVRSAPSSLAYVIYTSGSTGIPKGAMVEQRGLLNHLLSRISELGLSATDVIAQTAPATFDISIWQFLAPLMVGARVHICPEEEVRDPVRLAEIIGREGVTVLQIVPTLLRAILDRMPDEPTNRALSRLRWLICIGEALAPELCRNWLQQFPAVPMINAYGPAECSDTVATQQLTSAESCDTVPIGRPIANTCLYVLDAHLQPVPIGVAGELCVGGVGVGRGYLNDSKQTRRSFLRDPFSHRRAARLYRTGDLARWRADGILEFVGRVDHQVKIRGHRIELEQIEHILAEHPDVRSATVLARSDLGSEARLLAYVVGAIGRDPEVGKLRDFLKARLPKYMIPSGFIFLERMPLTAHGKVDRLALAAARSPLKVAASTFVPSRNSTEEILADIWSSLLKIEPIGVFDNFFELGGHSLLAGQVLVRVAQAFKVSLPLRVLFEAPTIAVLARRITNAGHAPSNEPAPEIAHVKDDGHQQPSILQEQMLRIERELPGLPQFNLPFAYRLQGQLNARALARSVAELVRRHDSLRTKFAWVDGLPVALATSAADFGSCLVVEDLQRRALSGNNRAKVLLLKMAALRAEQEACIPFDLKRAPLFRALLLKLGPDDHVLLLVLHHAIVDGWSIAVVLEEISELYVAFAGSRRAPLPKPELQFSDFARWQRQWCSSTEASRQRSYWRKRLRKAFPLFRTNNSAALLASDTAHEPVNVGNDLVARLRALGHSKGASLFMTLLAGFKTLLLARTGRKDICVATAMANRSQLRTERIIGPLVNMTLIRTRIDADLSFQEALARVRESVLDAYARQELPFELVVTDLVAKDDVDPASLLQVSFVLQNAYRPLKLPDIAVGSFAHRDGERVLPIDRSWLSVVLKETASGVMGACSYKSDLFEPSAIEHWMAEYGMILAKAAADPDMSLGRLVHH